MTMKPILTTLMTLGLATMVSAAAGAEPPVDLDAVNDGEDVPTDDDDASVGQTPSRSFEERPAVGDLAICPVRLMTFSVEPGTITSKYRGRYYAFCCMACKAPFDASPEQYVPAKNGQRPDAVPSWVRSLGDLDI